MPNGPVLSDSSVRVFGILLTYQRQALFTEMLRQICAQQRVPDCLVVVDNEASEETAAIRRRFQETCPESHWVHLRSPKNLGSAGGWAWGMETVLELANDRDWVLTLDDDNPPEHEGLFRQMFEFAETQREREPELGAVGIVGARFNWRTGNLMRLPDEELKGPVRVDYVGNGHMAMYSVGMIRDIGPFQRELFFGHTEVEFGLRMRRAGYQALSLIHI